MSAYLPTTKRKETKYGHSNRWILGKIENNGVRFIIGEHLGDVSKESGWKGLKLEKAKSLSDLADILPCSDLENEVFKLQENLDLKEIRLYRVFHFFTEYDDVDSHSHNYLTG